MERKTELCRLCHSECNLFTNIEGDGYFQCSLCNGNFTETKALPNPEREYQRYQAHNNDVYDEGYRSFVSPISQAVLNHYSPSHRGLDFGSGPGPVISSILKERGYNIETYDPFFAPRKTLIPNSYDYIVCCEVAEHFHYPYDEFKLLHSLIKKRGELLLMTNLYDEQKEFSTWYYKNDSTHVFFYQAATLEWIKTHFNFHDLIIENSLTRLIR